ncbi:unnamed protein product [Leuciscus chuanchicus]
MSSVLYVKYVQISPELIRVSRVGQELTERVKQVKGSDPTLSELNKYQSRGCHWQRAGERLNPAEELILWFREPQVFNRIILWFREPQVFNLQRSRREDEVCARGSRCSRHRMCVCPSDRGRSIHTAGAGRASCGERNTTGEPALDRSFTGTD